jgi:hypothetical protein
MIRLPVVDEEHDLPDRPSLLLALQRWENEGGAWPGRLPASLISRDVQPDRQASGLSDRFSISAS